MSQITYHTLYLYIYLIILASYTGKYLLLYMMVTFLPHSEGFFPDSFIFSYFEYFLFRLCTKVICSNIFSNFSLFVWDEILQIARLLYWSKYHYSLWLSQGSLARPLDQQNKSWCDHCDRHKSTGFNSLLQVPP